MSRRHQRRAEEAMIPRSERGLSQSVLRQAEERGEQRGLQIGFAADNLNSAVQYLASMIDAIDQLVIINEAPPAAQQGQRMRTMISTTENLFGRTTLTKEQQLRLAAFDVRDALRDTAPYLAHSHRVFPFRRQHAEDVARMGLLYADLIHDLMKPIDPKLSEKDARAEINQRVKALADYVREKGGAAGEAVFQAMQQSTPKTGAPSGPKPVAKYTLEQTAYLKRLHNLKSRGEQVEKLMDGLKKLPAVKEWQRLEPNLAVGTRDAELVKRSVEVQVFDYFNGKTRPEQGKLLEQMQDNNPNWAKRGG